MAARTANPKVIDFYGGSSDMRENASKDVALSSFATADPTFLNYHAWKLRWADRQRSVEMAKAVLQHSRIAGASRAQGARRRNGLALRTLAWQARWRGEYEEAEDLACRALARLKGEGAAGAVADAHCVLAFLQVSRGRRDLAADSLEQAEKALSEQDDTATRIEMLVTRAASEMMARRLRDAQRFVMQAHRLATDAERARVEHAIARNLLTDDRPGEAMEHAFRAVHICKEYNNRLILPQAICAAGAAKIDLGTFDQGDMLLTEALHLARAEDDMRTECYVHVDMVRSTIKQEQWARALELAQFGLTQAQAMGDHVLQFKFRQYLACVQEKLGQTNAALQNMKALLALRDAERG